MSRLTSVELYTLQIISDHPLEKLDAARTWAAVAEAEENLTLLLQDGYRAVIRPWDYPYNDEQETTQDA